MLTGFERQEVKHLLQFIKWLLQGAFKIKTTTTKCSDLVTTSLMGKTVAFPIRAVKTVSRLKAALSIPLRDAVNSL